MHPYVQPYNLDSHLDELFKRYLSECTYSSQLRPETIKSYSQVYETFRKIMPETQDAKDLHPHVLNIFFERVSTRKRIVGKNTVRVGVKPSTIKTYYNKLIAFFKWLEEHEYVPKKSLVEKIRKPPDPVYDNAKNLNKSEVSKIIASIVLDSMDDVFRLKRDLSLVSLLLYTGIRRGELLGLRIQDLNFEKGFIYIRGETSKSKKSRNIPMNPILKNHLIAYLEYRKFRNYTTEALIVSTKSDNGLSQGGLKCWVAKFNRLSGVKFHLHQFRHTFACTLATGKADIISIRNALGHTTTRMTERYLRSIPIEDTRSYIDNISF